MENFLEGLALASVYIIFVVIVGAALVFYFTELSAKEYTKTEDFQGDIQSALLATVAVILLSLVVYLIPNNANASSTYFNDMGVYMGIDATRKQSPQCKQGAGTSNLGAWGNIWRRKNQEINIKYTHHSCFIGGDRNTYDAMGLEFRWKLWSRGK